MQAPPKRRVAVFSTRFLQRSQTFVYEELLCHERYEAEVFAWRRENGDRFPYPNVHVASPLYGATLFSPAFARRIATGGFSLVHAHFGTGAVYALPHALAARRPLVVTFHGYDVPLLWNNRRLSPEYWPYALLGRTILDRMTLGLCASTDLAELLVEAGVPRAKLRVHRLGVRLDAFEPGEQTGGAFQVVMVGRFVPKKGFAYGVQAFARLAAERPHARLVIVGEGPLEHSLRELVRSLHLTERVAFTGERPSTEVAQILRASHVLLAPSVVDRLGDRESGLIVAKEASACAVPVIGTVHGGIPEIVAHGETGLLAQERDVDALAGHLFALHDDPRLRRRLGAAARAKMVAEYDNRERVRALEALYDEAIAIGDADRARRVLTFGGAARPRRSRRAARRSTT